MLSARYLLPLLALALVHCKAEVTVSGTSGQSGGKPSGGSSGAPSAGSGGAAAGATGQGGASAGGQAGSGGVSAGASGVGTGGATAGAAGETSGSAGSATAGAAGTGAGGEASGAGGASAGAGGSAAGAPSGGQAGGTASGAGGEGTAGSAGGPVCEVLAATHTGEGTYYDATGAGNCSFPATPDDLMVGAMNAVDYAGSSVCGTCAAVTGPQGTVTVRIVDQCPECKAGDIDLSPQAFAKLAPLDQGRIDISWHYVSCPVSGPVVYHFKEGSNPWWSAVQVRNHRQAIATFEVLTQDGTYKKVDRVDYNYFVDPSGMGPGPYTFRITDVLGHVLVDTGIPFVEAGDSPGAAQFPACGG